MKMTGNTILITGGTSGIGLGLALRLHEAGNKVIVAGRRKELLDQITAEHPGIDALVLDVADPDSIARASETLAASHPGLNVLVNNAGIMLRENLLDPGRPAGRRGPRHDQPARHDPDDVRLPAAAGGQGRRGRHERHLGAGVRTVPDHPDLQRDEGRAALVLREPAHPTGRCHAGVQVIEVAPPGVRTTLLGQQDDEQAMPLDEFLTETLDAAARESRRAGARRRARQVRPRRARPTAPTTTSSPCSANTDRSCSAMDRRSLISRAECGEDGSVDNKALADFLRHRREMLRRRDVGLVEGPRRRTQGLRR